MFNANSYTHRITGSDMLIKHNCRSRTLNQVNIESTGCLEYEPFTGVDYRLNV